jgi:hypothetical protein
MSSLCNASLARIGDMPVDVDAEDVDDEEDEEADGVDPPSTTAPDAPIGSATAMPGPEVVATALELAVPAVPDDAGCGGVGSGVPGETGSRILYST